MTVGRGWLVGAGLVLASLMFVTGYAVGSGATDPNATVTGVQPAELAAVQADLAAQRQRADEATAALEYVVKHGVPANLGYGTPLTPRPVQTVTSKQAQCPIDDFTLAMDLRSMADDLGMSGDAAASYSVSKARQTMGRAAAKLDEYASYCRANS